MNDEAAVLLTKYNPYLVIFPQEPRTRTRPGARTAGRAGWGDYHPCSAEFLLARAYQRDEPPPYSFRDLLRAWRPLPRTGIFALRTKLASVSPEETAPWELDIADIPSQSEESAWEIYADLLDETNDPYECVVYGRYVAGPAPALQYWYLYLYNDFRNNHEADWEMAAIALSSEGTPERMGLSSHYGGTRRDWKDVRKIGERPVIYAARGSHANYFSYDPHGFAVIDLRIHSDAPLLLAPLSWLVQRLPVLRRWRDQPAADPDRDRAARPEHIGKRIDPAVRVMPDEFDRPGDGAWWWLRYRGRWGSSHPRVAGAVGIDTPWGKGGWDARWINPAAWVASCRPAGGPR
jgi:hypothetical protein